MLELRVMKSPGLLPALLIAAAVSAGAADESKTIETNSIAPTGPLKLESAVPTAAPTNGVTHLTIAAPARDVLTSKALTPDDTFLGRRVVFGGLLTDMKRADHPFRVLDPRAPRSVGTGAENLSYYPRSERVQGVVLFSIRF